jgi:RNA polymerase primary sigma factor
MEVHFMKSTIKKTEKTQTKTKLTQAQAVKKLLGIFEEKQILTEKDLDDVFSQADLDEKGYIEALADLKEKGAVIDEDSAQERYLDDIEEADEAGQEDGEEEPEAEGEEAEKPEKPLKKVDFKAKDNNSGTSTLDMYFSDIGKYPLLNREQEIELSKRIKQGDEEAKEELIDSNLRLVASIASKYKHKDSSLAYDDLIGYGNIGLIRAAERFDYTKGCRFSTFASYWIRQAITRSMPLNGRTIKIPVYVAGELTKIKAAEAKLTVSLARTPTSEEIAKYLGSSYSASKVDEMLSYDQTVSSLDQPAGNSDDDTPIGNFVPDESNEADEGKYDEDIAYAMSKLTDRERKMVAYHFGLGDEAPHSLEETGKLADVTRERARQIIAEALKKMEKTLTTPADGEEEEKK